MIDSRLLARLHSQAQADRWHVSLDAFGRLLEAGAAKACGEREPTPADLARYLSSLHLEDVALACACADGDDSAWQHFVITFRPQLYRAADAIDPTGGARDLADSLYADLFGLRSRGERNSLFRYFHGRSSLATWLRAVLSQRFVDRLRERQRMDALPEDDSEQALAAPQRQSSFERSRFVRAMNAALAMVLAVLAPKDRLRLACYYAQQMTLAQVGRLLGEHEATVSRQLARTRVTIRSGVERHLRDEQGLSAAEIAECFVSLSSDPGTLDLGVLLATSAASTAGDVAGAEIGKKSDVDRSNEGRLS
jgi:RNA polymerase sigma-70 factor